MRCSFSSRWRRRCGGSAAANGRYSESGGNGARRVGAASGEDPLKLLSDVEADLGIMCHPITWPIFRKDDITGGFVGVYDRRLDKIYLFEKDVEHGARRATTTESSMLSDETHALLGDATYDNAQMVGAAIPLDRLVTTPA